MARVSIWYDAEADLLDISFGEPHGDVIHDPSSDDRVLQAIDESGAVVGLLIHPLSSLARDGSLELDLLDEAPADTTPETAEALR